MPNRIVVADRPPLITGPWRLEELNAGRLGYPKSGLKVFSCFHCGGGSSMGYKLAGFDVIGGVEIDPEMMRLYHRNLLKDTSLSFLMGVQDFVRCEMEHLPPVMYDLDVLDGSPPCSSFSMAGARERLWGEEKRFREGQKEQVLDDLFFDYIAIAKRLRPKVVVAENVKGLILGNARGYVKQIFRGFREAGYDCQLFLLNASRMGVPQARERTFFIARRADLKMPKITMRFEEDIISLSDAMIGLGPQTGKPPAPSYVKMWGAVPHGGRSRHLGINKAFNFVRLHPDKPCPTMTSQPQHYLHWKDCRLLSRSELCRIQSFPEDYDFLNIEAGYVCGMSVPPLMMQRVATEIAAQLLAPPA